MIVLLTGFEPNNNGLNASELVIKSLAENPTPEIEQYMDSMYFEIMPGNTDILENSVAKALKQYSPDICILTGQSDRNKVTPERIATNIRHFVTPDRAGNTPKAKKITQDGPAAYWSTLPGLDDLPLVLEQHNIPAAISNHGGTHLCNQIFYHALHFAAVNSSNLKSGFIHIPVLPEQVIKDWPKFPFMPIEMTRKALSLIIKHVITGHENSIGG